jgi:hypothetical protein
MLARQAGVLALRLEGLGGLAVQAHDTHRAGLGGGLQVAADKRLGSKDDQRQRFLDMQARAPQLHRIIRWFLLNRRKLASIIMEKLDEFLRCEEVIKSIHIDRLRLTYGSAFACVSTLISHFSTCIADNIKAETLGEWPMPRADRVLLQEHLATLHPFTIAYARNALPLIAARMEALEAGARDNSEWARQAIADRHDLQEELDLYKTTYRTISDILSENEIPDLVLLEERVEKAMIQRNQAISDKEAAEKRVAELEGLLAAQIDATKASMAAFAIADSFVAAMSTDGPLREDQ